VKDNQYWREIRHNKVTLKKANKSLTHSITLDWLIVAYVQFVTMLTELQKVLSQEPSVCVARLPQPYQNEPYQKLWIWVSYIFISLYINKYIVQKGMYSVQKCIYTVYTVHIYSTGPYAHYWYSHTVEDKAVNPLKARIYTILKQNFVFDLHNFNFHVFFRNVSLA